MADNNMKDVLTPDLGTDHPVPIAEVFVSPGDVVKKEDPLLSLESEKAVMDLPSPFDGRVAEVLVEADQEISAGDLLMRIEIAGGEEPVPEKGPEPEAGMGKEPTAAEEKEPVGENVSPAVEQVAAPGLSHASPSVRLYARELGVDLTGITGSGPKGRIRREDVQAYVKTLVDTGGRPAGTAGTGLPLPAYRDPSEFGPVRDEALTGVQKISASHLHASWVNIPHVTHFDKADITGLEEWRKALNASEKGTRKYTTLAFAVKALAAAVKEFPRFNGVLSPEGDRVILREYYNTGIAVDTPRGLLVPVIRDTDRKGLGEIADDIALLAEKGREGKLKPEDLQGAGITITNLGGIGGTAFTPIINPPEVAILGLSRAAVEPVWNGEEFVPRLMLPLSLSYDHRVIDGALAAAFAARLAGFLSDLRNTLL